MPSPEEQQSRDVQPLTLHPDRCFTVISSWVWAALIAKFAFYMCLLHVRVLTRMLPSVCVEVGGQPTGVNFLLPPCGPGFKLKSLDLVKCFIPTEPSH